MEPTSSSEKRGSASIPSAESDSRETEKQPRLSKERDDEEHPNTGAADTTANSNTNTSADASLEGVTVVETALLDKILSFLTANEESDLCVTCKFFRQQIEARRTFPCVIRQEQMPTKMAYAPLLSGYQVSVEQRQPFRFLVRTDRKEKELKALNIELKLVNFAWTEQYNFREAADDSPGATHIHLCVKTKKGKEIFNVGERISPHYREGPDDRANVYLSLACLAAVFRDGGRFCQNFPSFEYMIHQLPKRYVRDYLPDFNWDGEYRDRRTELEFAYRPAKTLKEWYDQELCRNVHPYEVLEFDLDELPWYRQGYWPDDDDSFEYYWDKNPWLEESTCSSVRACWRRVKGSPERGQLCIARLYRFSQRRFKQAQEQPVDNSVYGGSLPVPSTQALVVERR